MTENLIGELLAQQMRARGMSTRDVASETGVAHTTVMRVLKGNVVSVKTLTLIAEFLRTDPGNFLTRAGGEDQEELAKNLAAIVGSEPALQEVLQNAAAKVQAGTMSADVLKEIISYAAWRISQEKPGA